MEKIEKESKVPSDIYHLQLDRIGQDLIAIAHKDNIDWPYVFAKADNLYHLGDLAQGDVERKENIIDSRVDIVHVTSVEPLENYRLRVRLNNGRKGIFDMSSYLSEGVFIELKDPAYFDRVYIDYGTVVWPHEQDIAPDTIEFELQPEPEPE
jgi:hypothetical protein